MLYCYNCSKILIVKSYNIVLKLLIYLRIYTFPLLVVLTSASRDFVSWMYTPHPFFLTRFLIFIHIYLLPFPYSKDAAYNLLPTHFTITEHTLQSLVILIELSSFCISKWFVFTPLIVQQWNFNILTHYKVPFLCNCFVANIKGSRAKN